MKKKKQGIVITSLLVVSLTLVVIGVSFAFFTYSRQGSKENTITTGSLTFVYDEKKAEGNGITLSNAFPMSDEDGKAQSGDHNVFDFQVLATTKGASISYEVIGKKDDSSTLPENVTKIYLTTLSGSEESEVATTVKDGVVTTYDELSDTQIKEQTGKTLYQEVIPIDQIGYQKNFRLRMWLSEEANTTTNGSWDYNNKTFTIRINVVANGEGKPIYQDESGANVPELVDGMIPVTYDEENKSWIKADTSSEWYNYNNQEWANAVTVTEENRAAYMSAKAGTVISMEDINTMWVWIPRYEYQYTNLGDQYAGGTQDLPGEIKVNFLSGTSTTPSDSANYKVHPAFTFGTDQLTGLWYAKFETGGTLPSENYCRNESCDISSVVIKPNVQSLTNQSVSSFFYIARSMQMNANNPYGFSSIMGDLHMSKNSEWGAVAYLSQSRYGKYGNSNYTGTDKEIAINNCSNYITGIGGDTVDATKSEITCTINTYETRIGQAASTTGNITGIYDMSGGSYEYVMGNYNRVMSNANFNNMLDVKYYDLYTTEEATTACNGGVCYGHALSETSAWYQDAGFTVRSSYPWGSRGGRYDKERSSGIFYSGNSNGSANKYYTSRFVIGL